MLRLPLLAIVAVALAVTALLAASLGQASRQPKGRDWPIAATSLPTASGGTTAGELAAGGTEMPKGKPQAAVEAAPATATPAPASLPAPTAISGQASAPAATSVAQAAVNPASEMSNVERLTIKFQGYGDLSGEYRIGADGTIAIPVIGRIAISGLTVEQLERELANLVTQATGRESYVTVEVSEYHPVLVAGRVGKPGSAPWRPNMTVLHAVALTGGLQRDTTLSSALGEKTLSDLKRTLATLARIEAELKGAQAIDIPARLLEVVPRGEAEQLVAAQLSILTSNVNAFGDKLAGISRNEKLLKQEVAALDEQALRLDEQLAVRTDLMHRLESLIQRGHVVNDRLINERVNIAALQEKISATSVARSKAQTQLQSTAQEIQKATLERRAALDAEKNKLERDLAQFEIELKSSGEGGVRHDSGTVDYEIVRQDGGAAQTIKATAMTQLRPGDLIIVKSN